jgi:hypothetical protein
MGPRQRTKKPNKPKAASRATVAYEAGLWPMAGTLRGSVDDAMGSRAV